MQTLEEQLALMQKRVKVTLDWLDESAFSIGTLVGLSEDGQATIIDDTGIRNYCWPALKIEEVYGDVTMPEVEETIKTANDNKLWVGLVASILGLCLLTVIVGLTVKFVFWVIP